VPIHNAPKLRTKNSINVDVNFIIVLIFQFELKPPVPQHIFHH